MKGDTKRIIFRNRNILYWITTVMVTAEVRLGEVCDILQTQYVRGIREFGLSITVFGHTGYPDHHLAAWLGRQSRKIF